MILSNFKIDVFSLGYLEVEIYIFMEQIRVLFSKFINNLLIRNQKMSSKAKVCENTVLLDLFSFSISFRLFTMKTQNS